MTQTNRTSNDIAEIIREVDGDNQMSPAELGATIASRLIAFYGDDTLFAADVVAFVEDTNRDKRMGSDHLAELIVAEFNLTQDM